MMMHDTVYNYEVGADDLFVSDDKATRVIADLFEGCGWDGDPTEMAENPQGKLDLLEVDDSDGTGLYGAEWYHVHTPSGLNQRLSEAKTGVVKRG